MKRRSFFQLLLAMAGIPLLPKIAAKPPKIVDDMGYGLTGYYPPIPPGTIQPYLGSSMPLGWLPCDGRVLSPKDYPALWEAMGTPYKFQLPNPNVNILMHAVPDDERYPCLGWHGEPVHNHLIVDPGHSHGAQLYGWQYIIKT